MSDAEARAAILVEAEESLHLSPENIAVDWHRIRAEGDAAHDAEGVLVAVSKAEIDRHLAILESARLYPVAVDVSCLSVCNLVMALKDAELTGKVFCVVCVADDSADVAILHRNGAIYPRTIYFRSLEPDAIAKYLAESVLDVLKYYQFKLNPTPVDKLILMGNVSEGDPIPARLREAIDLQVELWDPLRDPRVAGAGRLSRIGPADSAGRGMAAALGLALRGCDHG